MKAVNTALFLATEHDMERLLCLLDDAPGRFDGDEEALRALRRKLYGVQLVPRSSLDPEVVTLYSRVHVHDPTDGERMRFELVPPAESDPERHRLSILAPLGAAVFGCRAGSTIEVAAPAGPRRIRILEVRQPVRKAHRFVVPWQLEAGCPT